MTTEVTREGGDELLDDEDGMTVVATFTVDGEPLSKARARFTKYGSKTHAYTPERTKVAEGRVRAAYMAATRRVERDSDAGFRVEADFYCGTRQRRDVDNMLKLVLDGLNGIAWPDDVQVLEVSGRKRFVAKNEARTEVAIFLLREGMNKPTRPCVRCGKPFRTYESWDSDPKGKKFCSRECAYAFRVESRARTCEHCGDSFQAVKLQRPTRFCSRECSNAHGKVTIPCSICGVEFTQFKSWVTQGRTYCSKDCSDEHRRRRARERRSEAFPGTCLICGGGTTRKEYSRCSGCRGKQLPEEAS